MINNKYLLFQSPNPNKKFMILTPEGKTVYFGQNGASDYTIHKDDKRRMNYIARHKSRENWNDLNKAGTWSRYLLWEKPTLNEAIRNMERRFNIKINFKNY